MRFMKFAALVLTALFLQAGCASAQHDGNGPAIIAIGDLHGDYDAYESLLREAGLINKRGKWAAGDTIFVQTGDIADRGADSKKIIEHLQKLKKQAKRKAGQVITLVGNHEAMNVTGDLRYVHPGEYEAFVTRGSKDLRDRVYEANRERLETAYLERDPNLSSVEIKEQWEASTPLGMIEHQQAWRPDGEIGAWVAANPVVARVGDSLFLHGGISPAYATMTVEEINAAAAAALTERSIDENSIIHDANGPLWYRGLVARPDVPSAVEPEAETNAGTPAPTQPISDEQWQANIDAVLANFGVSRIIIGHTPSLTGINMIHDGKVIQIDTGIAQHYGGTRSFLRIEDGKLFAHDNGEITELSAEEME